MLEEELNRRKQEDISPMQPLESVIPSDQYSQQDEVKRALFQKKSGLLESPGIKSSFAQKIETL